MRVRNKKSKVSNLDHYFWCLFLQGLVSPVDEPYGPGVYLSDDLVPGSHANIKLEPPDIKQGK